MNCFPERILLYLKPRRLMDAEMYTRTWRNVSILHWVGNHTRLQDAATQRLQRLDGVGALSGKGHPVHASRWAALSGGFACGVQSQRPGRLPTAGSGYGATVQEINAHSRCLDLFSTPIVFAAA